MALFFLPVNQMYVYKWINLQITRQIIFTYPSPKDNYKPMQNTHASFVEVIDSRWITYLTLIFDQSEWHETNCRSKLGE